MTRVSFPMIRVGCWLGSAMLLAACNRTEPAAEAPTSLLAAYMQDPAAVERGARIYDGTCAQFCHEAEPRVGEEVNLFDCQWRYGNTADEIFQITTSGIPGTRMVGYGNNFPEGKQDLWKLIAFIKTKQPECETSEMQEIQ